LLAWPPVAVAELWTLDGIPDMALDAESALDNLTRMVQVIGRDRELRQWFSALTEQSAVERRNEIFMTSEKMRAEGKDTELVASFRLLADSRVFDAARLALQEYDKKAV
jgi:hypothetical protein